MFRLALVAFVVAGFIGAALGSNASARTMARGCGSIITAHGYANQIRVARARCPTGRRVARSFNGCRARHHRGTRCRSQLGYRCTTRGRVSAPSQFYEYARCTRGRRTITFINSVNL